MLSENPWEVSEGPQPTAASGAEAAAACGGYRQRKPKETGSVESLSASTRPCRIEVGEGPMRQRAQQALAMLGDYAELRPPTIIENRRHVRRFSCFPLRKATLQSWAIEGRPLGRLALSALALMGRSQRGGIPALVELGIGLPMTGKLEKVASPLFRHRIYKGGLWL